jgi:hypothetical protein
MRSLNFALAVLLGLSGLSALAQAPPVIDTGTRPGHVPGVGDSLPKSDKASNIIPADTKSNIAPTLPSPRVGEASAPDDYLRAARIALAAGHTGEAQQSLEMAETRSLDRSVAPSQAATENDSRFIAQIRQARRALGAGSVADAVAIIDLALAR